ncbi:MAG: hypothetical protein WCC36_13970 [Gammaproteobacteria bacterium]
MDRYVTPHRGKLVNLLVGATQAEALKGASKDFVSLTLIQRQVCDLELLMNGGFSPLTGFMNQTTYTSLLETLTLPDGALWPISMLLDVGTEVAAKLQADSKIAISDGGGFMAAILTVGDVWGADKDLEADAVYGLASDQHPGVRYLYEQRKPVYVSGSFEGHSAARLLRFREPLSCVERITPSARQVGLAWVDRLPDQQGHASVTAAIALQAAKDVGGHMPPCLTVGTTAPADLRYYTRDLIEKYQDAIGIEAATIHWL